MYQYRGILGGLDSWELAVKNATYGMKISHYTYQQYIGYTLLP